MAADCTGGQTLSRTRGCSTRAAPETDDPGVLFAKTPDLQPSAETQPAQARSRWLPER